jgi:hypothetical protein
VNIEQRILVHARVADLAKAAEELAAATHRRHPVALPRGTDGRRLLLALLAAERARNAKLIEALHEL